MSRSNCTLEIRRHTQPKLTVFHAVTVHWSRAVRRLAWHGRVLEQTPSKAQTLVDHAADQGLHQVRSEPQERTYQYIEVRLSFYQSYQRPG